MTSSFINQLRRLKYVALIEMGQSPPSSEYTLSADAGLPFLQGTADFGILHPSPHVYCPVPTKIAIAEDILFSVRAPVGKLNIADRKYGIGRGLCAIRCQHLDKGFAWWALHWACTQLAYEATGSTYEAVTSEDIANLLIPLPGLDTQKAIANYLDRETAKIDTLISDEERLLKLLQEKRHALITHVVTRGLNTDVPMQHLRFEFLNYLPEHWKVINLKFLGELRTGVTKGRNFGNSETVHVPYLRVANVQDGYLDLSDITQIEVLPEEIFSFKLEKGDVLMNEGGDADKLGRGAVWHGFIEPCLHQNHVFAVRCYNIEPDWLATVISSNYAKAYFESRSKQSTNLASISATNIKELPIVVPPPEERKAIMKHLQVTTSKLDKLRTVAINTVEFLRERRTALITAAITEQISVIM